MLWPNCPAKVAWFTDKRGFPGIAVLKVSIAPRLYYPSISRIRLFSLE